MIRRFFEMLDRWTLRWAGDRFFLIKLFTIALILRAGLILLEPNINLISDMLGYHESGISLLESGELRVKGRLSATRPPIYAVFIYYIYYLFGTGNLLALRLSQGVVGSFTVILTYMLAEKVFSRKVAVWAGILYALYPAAIGFCDLILSEMLFTFFFIAALIFLVDVPQGKIKDAFFAAILLGLATLTRTVLFQFPIFIAIVYLVFQKNRTANLARFAVFIITFWMILIPWLARNERVFDKPLLTTKSGVDFYIYNHNPLKFILLNYSLQGGDILGGVIPWQLSEVERDQICKEAGIEWVKTHPFLFLFKGIRMQWNFFGVEREYIWTLMAGYWGDIPRWVLVMSFLIFAPTIYVLMPLFIWGVVYSWGKYPKVKNLLLMLVYFLAVTFVYFGFSRHRSPLNPVMTVFAGYAIVNWKDMFAELKLGKIFKHPRAAISVGILGFFIIGWALEIVVDVGSFVNLGFQHEQWQNITTAP